MPQDTVWTGQYQKINEQEKTDTSFKYVTIKIDTSAVDRIFSPTSAEMRTLAPTGAEMPTLAQK